MKVKDKALLLLITIAVISHAVSAYAADRKKAQKTPPVSIRTVQKESADGIKIFSTVQEAINSITEVSASNRYIIKIMPGTYNESVKMKEYADIEGSGQDNTIITSSATVTLTVANNTKIKNIKIINTAPDAGDNEEGTAVLFNGVTAKAEAVSVESQGTARRSVIKIMTSSDVELNNVSIRSENSSPDKDNKGIAVRGRAVISKLHAIITGGKWATAVAVEQGGEIDMRGSVLEASDARYTDAVDVCCDNKVVIKGSKMIAAQGAGDTIGVYSNLSTKSIVVTNSEIRARFDAGNIVGAMGGTIKDSVVEGGFSESKLINCRDEKNKPISVLKPQKATKK